MSIKELTDKVRALEARVQELEPQLSAARTETHIHHHYPLPQPGLPVLGPPLYSRPYIGDPIPAMVPTCWLPSAAPSAWWGEHLGPGRIQ